LHVWNKKQEKEELVQTYPLSVFKTFDFPQLPKERYFVRLTTSLSSTQYDFKLPETIVDFNERTATKNFEHRVHVQLEFQPRLSLVPTELGNASFWPLIILTLLVLAVYHREELREWYENRSQEAVVTNEVSGFEYTGHSSHKKNKKARK
jgi:hypothetical protein